MTLRSYEDITAHRPMSCVDPMDDEDFSEPLDDRNKIYDTTLLLSNIDSDSSSPPPPYITNGQTCAVCPNQTAVWRIRPADGALLSALAATLLVHNDAISPTDLEL